MSALMSNKHFMTAQALKRTVLLTWHSSPWLFLLLLLLKIASAIAPSIQIYFTKVLTDTVSAVLAGSNPVKSVLPYLACIFIIGLVSVAMELAAQYITLLLQQKTGCTMETLLARKSVSIPLSRLDQAIYYDQLQRARSTISYSGSRVVDQLFSAGQSILTLISFIVLLSHFNGLLTLAMLLVVLPALLVNVKIGQWKFVLLRFQTPFTRRLQYLFDLLTNRASAKEIRIYNLGQTLMQEWSSIYWKNASEQRKVELRSIKARTALESMQSLLGFLFALYAVWICAGKGLTIGHYVAIYQVLVSAQNQWKMLAFYLSSLYEDALIMNEFYVFLDTEDTETDLRSPVSMHKFNGHLMQGIAVKNLSFRYPTSPAPVLKNITFTIKPNQTVAIVGENGSGKSTLVNCLIGLYRNYAGRIEYDGVELKEIDPSSFHEQVAVVFQDFLRFQSTPKENIGYGDVNRLSDFAAMETAAARSGASEVIDSLPARFDTLLGPAFEGGTELSVGQWQKLALARSFFKNSPIIVLDEPTASMDPLAEEALFRKFAELSEDKMTFLISHRLGSCRIADHILVLKDGELVEQGNHDELLKLGGEYSRMYRAQAEWYK